MAKDNSRLIPLTVSAILVLSSFAHSGECMNPPVTEELVVDRICDVSAAYTAHVVSLGDSTSDPDRPRTLNVEVTEVFKGEKHQLNRVLPPGYSGPHLNVGTEVLILADEVPGKEYVKVRNCSVSGPLIRTEKYLEAIRAAVSDYEQSCSQSTRDARAEILREQSAENMRHLRESWAQHSSEK